MRDRKLELLRRMTDVPEPPRLLVCAGARRFHHYLEGDQEQGNLCAGLGSAVSGLSDLGFKPLFPTRKSNSKKLLKKAFTA